MTPRTRVAACAAIIVLALVTGCLLAAQYLSDARAAMCRAAADLESCNSLAARIDELRSGATVPDGSPAAPDHATPTALHRRCQEALELAGLSPDHLLEVAPEAPRTVGQSAYKEIPTRLVLRDLSLHQLVQVLLSLTADHPDGSRVAGLWLHAPHDVPGDSLWTAEVTLSHLSFDPPTAVQPIAIREPE